MTGAADWARTGIAGKSATNPISKVEGLTKRGILKIPSNDLFGDPKKTGRGGQKLRGLSSQESHPFGTHRCFHLHVANWFMRLDAALR
jgi:hypothetical protein